MSKLKNSRMASIYRHPLNTKQIKEFAELEEVMNLYIHNLEELNKIKVAYDYAAKMHMNQKRKNGDDYIYHPLSTAFYLAQLKMGPQTIIAGLLHDILEDTPVSAEELEKEFGTEVATLVESLTKVTYFAKENREEQKSHYLRKIYLSMAQDIRVIIIKLCDRLHNMLTIQYLPIEKQQIIAKETLETYVSIAHRLGMREIKGILEDLSFQVIQSKDYYHIQSLLDQAKEERVALINSLIKELDTYLRKERHVHIVDIHGRSKSAYSIYRKMNVLGRSFEDLKDILAIRIVARNVTDCYKILGFIHQRYAPLTNRFKDYIAIPKNGVYQLLHTSVTDIRGNIFEIQIRTSEMDEVAESGVAAHWAYKEGEKIDSSNRQKEIDEQIDLFHRIIELDQQSASNKEEEIETIEKILKNDYFTSSIYVLTPEKKVISLPFGSTVLDFAFRIHSEIGLHTIGAKIDGIYSPIHTILKSGQIVEVKSSPKQEPNYDWLKIVTTSGARSRIRKYLTSKIETDQNLRQAENKINIERVRNNIGAFISQHDLKWKRNTQEEIQAQIKKLGYQNLDEFYLAIDRGEFSLSEAVDVVFVDKYYSKDQLALDTLTENKQTVNQDFKNEILVNNISNLKTKLALCCLPVPIEPIVGFITKNNGIKVHVSSCPNIQNEDKNRIVNVHWNDNVTKQRTYATNLQYYAIDRPNLIYDISKVLTSLKATTIMARLKSDEKRLLAFGVLKIKVKDSEHVNQIINALKSIPSVVDVKRTHDNRLKL